MKNTETQQESQIKESDDQDEPPYYAPINELNKISNVRNPREKLNCLLMMMRF